MQQVTVQSKSLLSAHACTRRETCFLAMKLKGGKSGKQCHMLQLHGSSNISQPVGEMHIKQIMQTCAPQHPLHVTECPDFVAANKAWESAHCHDTWGMDLFML